MKLSTAALNSFETHKTLKNLIAAKMERSEATVRRWVDENNPMLTTEAVLQIIESETGLKRSKILTQ